MILVFVGAGGSASVDPEQYPTTVEFFERLPREITQDPLFTLVREFLRSQKKDGQLIDIEEVLWGLDKLQEYFSLSRDPNTIEGWMMTGNRLGSLHATMQASSNISAGMFEIGKNQLAPLQNRINALAHEFYVEPPSKGKLQNWISLLQGLEERDPVIEIFTTNYDPVLETVIEEANIENVVTGRETGRQTTLNTSLWDKPGEPIDGRGRLTKLHGSVDWQRRGSTIICSDLYTGDPDQHSILHPGFKGEPSEEPFIKFHEHLRAVVQKADVATFVGFAFRDDYINDILSELRTDIPKYVINKDTSLPDLAFLAGCEHFGDGLTAETVEKCMGSLALIIIKALKQDYDEKHGLGSS